MNHAYWRAAQVRAFSMKEALELAAKEWECHCEVCNVNRTLVRREAYERLKNDNIHQAA